MSGSSFQDVREVYESSNVSDVNEQLEKGWVLLTVIGSETQTKYILGKVKNKLTFAEIAAQMDDDAPLI